MAAPLELNRWWRPAVKKDYCEVDTDLLSLRIALLAGSAFVLTLAAYVPAAIYRNKWSYSLLFIGAPLYILFVTILGIKEKRRAEHAADVKAVNEYLRLEHPTPSATLRIAHRFPAAQLLVNKRREAINIMNQMGQYLLWLDLPLDVFTLFVTNNIEMKKGDRERYAGMENPAYLECILEHNPRLFEKLSDDDQVDLWCSIGHPDAAKLLKKHGFDVNIRNSQKYTPLLKLAHYKYQREFYPVFGGITIAQHITALLACGAAARETIELGGKAYRASELTENGMMKHLLNQAETSLV